MKITVTGSLGNVAKPLIERLLETGNEVLVISSDSDRISEIEKLGAKAAIGSVSDAAFLSKAFSEADAIFAMTPPNLGGQNVIQNTIEAGRAFVEAFRSSGAKRVVLLSSIGADLPEGNGPIRSLHHIEQMYRQLEGIEFTFLRAGYFYTNFLSSIQLVKTAGIIGGNYPGIAVIPLVHPEDIATIAADELGKLKSTEKIKYVVSDLRKAGDIAVAFGAAIGKPELPWIEFTDEQSLEGMLQAGVPAEIAGLYTEMGSGFRKGIIQRDFIDGGHTAIGKTKLEDFAKEFAQRF